MDDLCFGWEATLAIAICLVGFYLLYAVTMIGAAIFVGFRVVLVVIFCAGFGSERSGGDQVPSPPPRSAER